MEEGESEFWWTASSLCHSLAFCTPNICAVLLFTCTVFSYIPHPPPPQKGDNTNSHSFTACISQSMISAWCTICSTGLKGVSCVLVTNQIKDKLSAFSTVIDKMYNDEAGHNTAIQTPVQKEGKNGKHTRVTSPKSDRILGRHREKLCHCTEVFWLNHASLTKRSSFAYYSLWSLALFHGQGFSLSIFLYDHIWSGSCCLWLPSKLYNTSSPLPLNVSSGSWGLFYS